MRKSPPGTELKQWLSTLPYLKQRAQNIFLLELNVYNKQIKTREVHLENLFL